MPSLSITARLARLGLTAKSVAAQPQRECAPLPGGEAMTPHGSFWLRQWLVQPGVSGVPDLSSGESPESLRAILHRRPCRTGVRVAFDTETTSLNSGAGVHVFLIGLATWEQGAVMVRQYLMRSPLEEVAMLHAVREQLRTCSAMLSFCGRGFDVPRIRDRLTLSGMPRQLPVYPHDDLAPVARRFMKGRFQDCRLKTLEQRVLGFERVDDLPGADCPREWFAMQRGQAHRMAEVLHHNALDLLSLFTLEAALLRELEAPATQEAVLAAAVCRREAGLLETQRLRV